MTFATTQFLVFCGYLWTVSINQTHFPCMMTYDDKKCSMTIECTTGRSFSLNKKLVQDKYAETLTCTKDKVPHLAQQALYICYECDWVAQDEPQRSHTTGIFAGAMSCQSEEYLNQKPQEYKVVKQKMDELKERTIEEFDK